MGQKINPISLRLGIIRGWESNWYGGKNFADKIAEDEKIRKYLRVRIPKGGISKIVIERTIKRIIITVHTAKPGIVIGKGGAEVDKIKDVAEKMFPAKQTQKIASNESNGHMIPSILLSTRPVNEENLATRLANSFTIGNKKFNDQLKDSDIK
jgi:ribosomal protein S3